MKVEFSIDEVQLMMDAVLDELTELKLSKTDRAAIRRWRTDSMSGGAALMQLLAEKVNEGLQQSHQRSEVSPIKKPDWAS